MSQKEKSPLPFKDSYIEEIAKKGKLPIISITNDLYLDIIEDIVSQQLSGKVAAVIFNRFLNLFPNHYPAANLLAEMSIETLRTAGLSNSKAQYVKNVAEFSLSNDLTVKHINSLTDEEIVALLTQIKGIGVWTAQMVLIFSLSRPDVFPIGDLAIQQGMKSVYGLKMEGKELEKKLTAISSKWKPNRTVGTRYIWQYVNMLKEQKVRY